MKRILLLLIAFATLFGCGDSGKPAKLPPKNETPEERAKRKRREWYQSEWERFRQASPDKQKNLLAEYEHNKNIVILVKALKAKEASIRLDAVGALTRLKHERAARYLADAVTDENPEVRTAVAVALKKLNFRHTHIIEMLEKQLAVEKDKKARVAIEETARHLQIPE